MSWEAVLTNGCVMKGFFCIEGIDGCGKSTQIGRLIEKFSKRGIQSCKIREPGGTTISEKVRNILLSKSSEDMSSLTELLLYNAARAQLIHEVIQPALDKNQIVLADRFAWSTLAYQGYGRELEKELISSLLNLTCGEYWPQLTFVLDIPVNVFRERSQAENRSADRIEQEQESFFERVRNGYRQIAQDNPESVILLDGTRSPSSLEDEIYQRILQEINKES